MDPLLWRLLLMDGVGRFGKSQSLRFVNDEGETEKDDQRIIREDFWASTGNKQLNFLQHISRC